MSYLMAGRAAEVERLRPQSRVWEPAGRRLLATIGGGAGLRVLDAGRGALGWLSVLSGWVGAAGRVVGTDVLASLLDAARELDAAPDVGAAPANGPLPAPTAPSGGGPQNTAGL